MAFDRAVSRRASLTAIALIVSFGAVAVSGCTSLAQGGGLFNRQAKSADNPVAIGVNAFLWRASLDTLAFMPLASADPYGGLINTEWYVNPEKTDERFKATVYILDTRLRADGINVSLHRQTRGANGEWIDAPASPDAEEAIENAILTRARQLRVGGR
jgi:hypothetical protein